MELDLQPQYYVVNFAHRKLQLSYPRAAFRVLQGFKKKSTAKLFSDDFNKQYDLDCFLMQKGKPMLIPNDYYFKQNPVEAVMRLEKIISAHKEKVKDTRQSFEKYVKESQRLHKNPELAEEEQAFAQNEQKKMIRMRQNDLEKSKAIMSEEFTGQYQKLKEEHKSAFKYAVVSCIEDTSEQKEHVVTIYALHNTSEAAKEHIANDLSKDVIDLDLHVVDVGEWIVPGMAFCEHIMEKVKRKYRNKQTDEHLQYHLNKRHKKRKEVSAFYKESGIEEPAPVDIRVDAEQTISEAAETDPEPDLKTEPEDTTTS